MGRGTLMIDAEALMHARLHVRRSSGGQGMTRPELAKEANISRMHLWRLESGDTKTVTDATILALANALQVEPDTLYRKAS